MSRARTSSEWIASAYWSVCASGIISFDEGSDGAEGGVEDEEVEVCLLLLDFFC